MKSKCLYKAITEDEVDIYLDPFSIVAILEFPPGDEGQQRCCVRMINGTEYRFEMSSSAFIKSVQKALPMAYLLSVI